MVKTLFIIIYLIFHNLLKRRKRYSKVNCLLNCILSKCFEFCELILLNSYRKLNNWNINRRKLNLLIDQLQRVFVSFYFQVEVFDVFVCFEYFRVDYYLVDQIFDVVDALLHIFLVSNCIIATSQVQSSMTGIAKNHFVI